MEGFRSWTEHFIFVCHYSLRSLPPLTGGFQWFTHRLLPTFQVVRVSERLTNWPIDSVLSQWGLHLIEKGRKCKLAQFASR